MPNQLTKTAVGSVRKTDVGSEKTENRDICSQGNANRDIRGPETLLLTWLWKG